MTIKKWYPYFRQFRCFLVSSQKLYCSMEGHNINILSGRPRTSIEHSNIVPSQRQLDISELQGGVTSTGGRACSLHLQSLHFVDARLPSVTWNLWKQHMKRWQDIALLTWFYLNISISLITSQEGLTILQKGPHYISINVWTLLVVQDIRKI